MKFEIKHRYTGSVLFECDALSLRIAVEKAVESGADLYGANLSGADLSGANLSGANLSGANLYGANLYGANLSGANLSGANLSGANLSGACLSGAYLSGANLSRAYLSGANLSRAYLSGADLSGADGINKLRSSSLYMLLDQVGPIRAYKIVTSDYVGIYNGGLIYTVGSELTVDKFDANEMNDCGAGINLATLDWCLREWMPDRRILVCEFNREDIVAIPIGSDGKFRVKRCKVVAEKTLDELGITKENEDRKAYEAERDAKKQGPSNAQ